MVELKEVLSRIVAYICEYGVLHIRDPRIFGQVEVLERMGIIRFNKISRWYNIEFEQLVKAICKELEFYGDVINFGVYVCVIMRISSNVNMALYFINPGYKEYRGFLLQIIQDVFSKYNEVIEIPIILVPESSLTILEEENMRRKILDMCLTNIKVGILPILLPIPNKLELFEIYKENFKDLKMFLEETEIPTYSDELSFILRVEDLIQIKYLTFFANIGDILRRYTVVKMKDMWKGVWKWFEEVIKLLLIKNKVRGCFPKDVVDFLIDMKTGGKNSPDIVIPVKRDNVIDILIIDTKHWKGSICEKLGTRHESYDKYVKYKNSKKTKSVISIIHKYMKDIQFKFSLIFVQRKSDPECIAKKSVLTRVYDRVEILGLNEFCKFYLT